MNESLRLVSVAETITTYDVIIGGDTNHLYPCTWSDLDNNSCKINIKSRGAGSSDPFNCNTLDAYIALQGWTDALPDVVINSHGMYLSTEVTIHSIWSDLKTPYGAIYLRGGLSYRISSNYRLDCSPTAKTYNGCTFGIMNADFSVTGAVLVNKLWTYTDGRTDARLDDFGTWARSAVKPAYTAAEVGAIPNTEGKFAAFANSDLTSMMAWSSNRANNGQFGHYNTGNFTFLYNSASNTWLKLLSSGRLTFNEKDVVLTDDPRLTNARPASDVSAWAKAATKPTTYFTELLTDFWGNLAAGSIQRHPLLKSSTSAGYIQRIAIGLKRPVVEGWGRGLFSVGTNDSGTTFADYEFDIGGRIYSPAGTFALLSEISWANLLNKPSCFTPCAHGHAWSEISGKPTTFAPTAHTHAMGDITGLSLDWSSITNKPNALSALNSRLILTPGNNEAGLILNRAGGGFLGIGNGGTSINKFGTCDANGSWIASTDAWKIYGTSLLFNDLAVCLTASPYAEASVNYLRFNFAMDGIEARNVLLNYMIKSTPTIAKYVFYAGNVDLAGITCSTIHSSTITSYDRVNAVNGFFQTSDKRIKSDIKYIELKSKEILLREYIRTDSKQHEYGIVALEIEEIYPEVVNTDKDGMKSVNYIQALVIKCAELDLKITLLDKKILELENKLNILLKKFA